MRHISDGALRRLDDEPLSVPDRVSDHVSGCGRCSARRARIADDAEFAARLLSGPQLVPDVDVAWTRLRRGVERSLEERVNRRPKPAPVRLRRLRLPGLSLRAGLAIGAVGIAVAGTAVAATLTTIFAPTHVAPVSLSQSDLSAIASFVDLGDRNMLGGFSTPNGSSTFRFGMLAWSSSGVPQPARSLTDATTQAGFPVSLPTRIPAGVGPVQQIVVQPRVSVTANFNSTAAALAGSSVTLTAGPAVIVQYGASSGNPPALAVVMMRRPTAFSTGASLSQIEAFLLAQPGIPPALAEEVRLLGDLRTTLPVPVPAGAAVRSVRVAGWPGVLLADSSNAAAGVVWEDGRGMLHVVAGILDPQDVLNVAAQLG